MSDEHDPLQVQWDGEVFRPTNPYWARKADTMYAVGEVHLLAPFEERSPKSHKHYFAEVREAFKQLPEDKLDLYPTPDALRKFALIKAKFCDVYPHVCNSRAEALRLAAYLRIDNPSFAIIVVKDNVVMKYVAKSQSIRSMGAKDFQRSKQAVLDILADLIGVSATELSHNTDKAA